jgi:hypothetical protein
MDEDSSDGEGVAIDAHDALRPDVLAEQTDTYRALTNAIQCLSVFEQKILKLKGVQLEEKP